MANLVTTINSASRRFPSAFISKWAMMVIDVYKGKFIEYYQLQNHPKLSKICNESYSNEMGRLCQGVGPGPDGADQGVKGTNTFHIIEYEYIPMDCRQEITYTKVVCIVLPQKADPNRTHIKIGGNRIC